MFTLNCYKKLSALKPRIIIRPFFVLFAIKKIKQEYGVSTKNAWKYITCLQKTPNHIRFSF